MTPRLSLVGAAVAAALAGVLIAYVLSPAAPPAATSADPATPNLPRPSAAPVLTATAPPVTPAPTGAQQPAWLKPANDQTPSLTLAELHELRDTLSASADPGDEFTRLTEQMLLADATRRFLQLRHSANPDFEELHGLVELIGPVLDAQLKRGELTRADAIDLKSKLLQVQYPQASMQQGELTRWLAAQSGR
jgi:hypothetical protein